MKQVTGKVDNFVVEVAPDLPDIRDWKYQPALVNLKRYIDPPRNLIILNQKSEGACTGFGLAGVINFFMQQRNSANPQVSARMLYEMAKRYDEWEGDDYSGSSCRGAIKGWHNMGVAEDSLWKYKPGKPGYLTLEAAKNARNCTIGAYYRVKPRLSDFHAALNETGVIYCSAGVHNGWSGVGTESGTITYEKEVTGGHAFAIVGYNSVGFWVQNSWGGEWGEKGLAILTYEDWQKNIIDAWVLRLALPTPQIWHLPESNSQSLSAQAEKASAPNRFDIAGHFVHVDDGKFHEKGKYWSSLADVKQTTKLLETSVKYDHILLYAHGGLNSPTASARRIKSMKQVFKDNRIYPFHFMYDTGILEELKDVIFRKRKDSVERTQGVTDASDWLIEKLTRIPGRALWREMKRGAKLPFNVNGAGTKTLAAILEAIHINNLARARAAADGGSLPPIKIHMIGHSTGAILLGWLLNRLVEMERGTKGRVSTVSLLAGAASTKFFDDQYVDLIKAPANQFGVDQTTLFNLTGEMEKDDTVGPYRKSLLYMVSRAFEEKRKTHVLGMQKYSGDLPVLPRLEVVYSKGKAGEEGDCRSETHGGFDDDPGTLNLILKEILPQGVTRPFKDDDFNP